jgi:Ca2+-binding EF-hand superfamily protein
MLRETRIKFGADSSEYKEMLSIVKGTSSVKVAPAPGAQHKFRIKVLEGPYEGEQDKFTIDEECLEYVLGTSTDECDLNLEDDPDVSEEHAEITFAGGAFWFTDLASTNGSEINDVPCEPNEPVRLVGDKVKIKLATSTVIRFTTNEKTALPRSPRVVFDEIDTDKNGSLSKAEVHAAFRMLAPSSNHVTSDASLGRPKEDQEVDEGLEDETNQFDEIFLEMEKGITGEVSFDEFKKHLFYRTLFHELDQDISGSLDKKETRAAFAKLRGKEMSDAEFEELFQCMDTDGDGTVSFAEMKKAFFEKRENGRR